MALSKLKYTRGLRDGVPIGLGYLSVSFGFGISAVGKGLGIFDAVLISMTNLTSAGQVAGVDVICAASAILITVWELIACQFIINLRYCLMGLTLTQKLDERFNTMHRMLVSFFITDEIFAVASSKSGCLSPAYMYGLSAAPWIGWTLGTLLGAVSGSILPTAIANALGFAIYGMFIAIVIPPAKKERGVLFAAVLAAAISCVIYYIPALDFITSGFSVIICAVIAAALAAVLFPVKQEEEASNEA